MNALRLTYFPKIVLQDCLIVLLEYLTVLLESIDLSDTVNKIAENKFWRRLRWPSLLSSETLSHLLR